MQKMREVPPGYIRDVSNISTQPLPTKRRPSKFFNAKSPFFYCATVPSLGCLLMVAALVACIAISLIRPFGVTPSIDVTRPFTVPTTGYVVAGKPTLDAAFINRVLAHYQSPAQNRGQVLYDYGLKYGIDPAYALAFFMQESRFGTQGVATVTHSLGNIRATTNEPSYNGYRSYQSWEEGFEDWYRLIANTYVNQWRLYTVDQIIPVYAPNSDHNDEAIYIRNVKIAVSKWRAGIVVV